MRERFSKLDSLGDAIWQELQQASQDREHAWRSAVLATTSPDGPDARSVILREVDRTAQQLVVYSDSRAAKLAQLRADPRAMLVMWSRPLGWQLRCRAVITVHTDGLAATSRWVRVKQSPTATDYLSPLAPGEVLDDPDAARESPVPTPAHFAVIEAQLLSIDWLELHANGHRRARLDSQGARWLQP